jgi:hypothetical protein
MQEALPALQDALLYHALQRLKRARKRMRLLAALAGFI